MCVYMIITNAGADVDSVTAVYNIKWFKTMRIGETRNKSTVSLYSLVKASKLPSL